MRRLAVPADFYRGGTSKAVLFDGRDLSRLDPSERTSFLLSVMGSPDPHGRQLDGMGGGLSSVSKVAIVSPVVDGAADVEFDFGQVAVDRPTIDFSGTCGNISAAVAPFALDHAMVEPVDGACSVVFRQAASGLLVRATVQVSHGRVVELGEAVVDGVSGTGSPIALEYLDPAGTLGHGLLPTGAAADLRHVDGRRVRVSVVDATIPVVFVRAVDVGLTGDESVEVIEGRRDVMDVLSAVRRSACAMLDLATEPTADALSPAVPKVAVVAPSPSEPTGFQLRMLSMGRVHRAIAGTTAMCAAVAALTPGTTVHEVARFPDLPPVGDATTPVRILHPAGSFQAVVATSSDGGSFSVPSVAVVRTARLLMRGDVHGYA